MLNNDAATLESVLRRRWVAQWGSIGLFVINAAVLLTYHNANAADDGAADQVLWRHHEFPISKPLDMLLFGVLVLMAFELLDFCTKNSGKWLGSKLIPVRGKHLDDLRPLDIFCIGFSKANTAPFTYFYLRYCWNNLNLVHWREMTVWNTLLPLPILFVLFDVTYCLLHCFLHLQWIYPYIHKHHHIQKAPSRANVDAVNVHPVEFVLGEYNHMLILWFCHSIVGIPIHFCAAVLLLAIGGVLAGINHTRYDVVIEIPLPRFVTTTTSAKESTSSSYWTYLTMYDSKAHDVHHRIPQSNYGQYTMLWDYLFGSYRPYNPNDRVNADSQLDPTTGKTVVREKVQ